MRGEDFAENLIRLKSIRAADALRMTMRRQGTLTFGREVGDLICDEVCW
jgi:hypothetical protein